MTQMGVGVASTAGQGEVRCRAAAGACRRLRDGQEAGDRGEGREAQVRSGTVAPQGWAREEGPPRSWVRTRKDLERLLFSFLDI